MTKAKKFASLRLNLKLQQLLLAPLVSYENLPEREINFIKRRPVERPPQQELFAVVRMDRISTRKHKSRFRFSS